VPPALPWAGSQIGRSDEVLAPWTPLTYDGDANVSCWGRTYTFDGPFLKEALHHERNLLSGPVTMTLTTTRGTGTLVALCSQARRKDAHRAEFSGTGNFGPAGLDADWSMWMEYDGSTVATITLRPAPGGTDARRLALRSPPSRAATLAGRRSLRNQPRRRHGPNSRHGQVG
jgi:hypothetical protein